MIGAGLVVKCEASVYPETEILYYVCVHFLYIHEPSGLGEVNVFASACVQELSEALHIQTTTANTELLGGSSIDSLSIVFIQSKPCNYDLLSLLITAPQHGPCVVFNTS